MDTEFLLGEALKRLKEGQEVEAVPGKKKRGVRHIATHTTCMRTTTTTPSPLRIQLRTAAPDLAACMHTCIHTCIHAQEGEAGQRAHAEGSLPTSPHKHTYTHTTQEKEGPKITGIFIIPVYR